MENQKIYHWLDKIEQEAYNLGLNYFIAVGKGSLGNVNVRMNNVCSNSNITDIIKHYEQLTKKFAGITFADLYNYIQTAKRDEYGYHYPFKTDNIVFHIYEHKCQVNICMKDENGNYNSNLNIIYYPNDTCVSIVPVKNGIALYDNAKIIKFTGNTDINSVNTGDYHPLSNVIFHDYEIEFKNVYNRMVSIISDALSPWKSSNN